MLTLSSELLLSSSKDIHLMTLSVALQFRDGSSVTDCSINSLCAKKQLHLFHVIGNQIAKKINQAISSASLNHIWTRTNNASLMLENGKTLKKHNPWQNIVLLESLIRIIFEYAGNSASGRKKRNMHKLQVKIKPHLPDCIFTSWKKSRCLWLWFWMRYA